MKHSRVQEPGDDVAQILGDARPEPRVVAVAAVPLRPLAIEVLAAEPFGDLRSRAAGLDRGLLELDVHVGRHAGSP